MAMLNFFKVTKHQRFGYIPRHWDPDKEELEARVKRAEKVSEGSAEAVKARLATGFRNRAGYARRENTQQTFRSNMILLVVIVGLILASYIAIQVYLPKLLKFIE